MRFHRQLLFGATFLTAWATGAAAQDVELTFRYAYENVDEVRAGLDVFEEQNPGISVTLERIAFKDARDQFIREAATGGGPDVLHLAFVWI
jgi:multiple sugar transport system substrate-binding protein